MTTETTYPIGTPNQPWRDAEKLQWRALQVKQRSYQDDVVTRIDALRDQFDVFEYGNLDYTNEKNTNDRYTLYAVRPKIWREDLPCALVTGGVHGYETSGVLGALQFAAQAMSRYADRINVLLAPCISPWAFERIHRWNPHAIDPNRSFRENSQSEEAAALMRLIAPLRTQFLLHIDLHETTDTDESEFRPALAARDGKTSMPGEIPDGFYTVGDTENPQLEFQQAVIQAVEKVTHIAPADVHGEIIGSPVVAHGVILYPLKQLGLCGGVTEARFTTTTEVYPDSPRATPAQCNDAQVAAVCAAIEYALANR